MSSPIDIENTDGRSRAKIKGMRTARPLPEPISPESPEAVARRLKALRLTTGLEPKEMSKALGLAGTNTWSNWETMVSPPKIANGILICRRFGVTLDYIYLGDLSCVSHNLAQQLEERLREL